MKTSGTQNHTLFTTSTLGGAERYRFGFQGQEAENEIWGEGNASFYKYRISDNRLGRFFAVDPLYAQYPHNSPYAFSENRVIDRVELEGLESTPPPQMFYHPHQIQAELEGSVALYNNSLVVKYTVDFIIGSIDGTMFLVQGVPTAMIAGFSAAYNDVVHNNPNKYIAIPIFRLNPGNGDYIYRGHYEGNLPYEDGKALMGATASRLFISQLPISKIAKEISKISVTLTLDAIPRIEESISNITTSSFENKLNIIQPSSDLNTPSNQFHVIAGSFSNQQNAINYANEVGGTVLEQSESGHYRVSVYSTDNYNDAANYQSNNSSDSWILKE